MKTLDFIGIGVQKAATTWLFRWLEEHPNISGAHVENNKELNFFNHHYDKGYLWYHSHFEFGPWKNGEFSVLYFYDKNVPARIYDYNSKVKLLVCFRNPIDRAYSHHLHQIKRNRLRNHLYKFLDAAKYNPTYIEMGRYATHIERYLEFFDPSQIHVILFDDIISKPGAVMQNLFKFLEVDDQFSPSLLNKKVYAAHTYRSHALEVFFNTTSNFLRKPFRGLILRTLKATKLPALIRSYNELEIDHEMTPALSKEERKYLYDIFAEEMERLGALINRDLSMWK